MKTIKLAIIGYGNVGKAFGRMLEYRKQFIRDKYDCDVKIVAVSTRSKGSVVDNDGIDMEALDMEQAQRIVTSFEVINNADYDVMVELTPINIETGQPAIDHIKCALQRGKHVITANKGPIAWAYRELRDLAAEHHALFYHEATVMDGIPIFNMANETLKGCEILEIKGILNSTTNFILNELEKGVSFDDALEDGKRRGFVEADPSMDLEGWDASVKLTALMNVLMDVEITPKDIIREGIGGITAEQIQDAKKEGRKYKLLCHGRVEDGKPVGSVRPELVDGDSVYASINGTAAMVTIRTDLMGEVSIIEGVHEPEIDQTAYGVLSDLLRILTELER